MPEIKWDDSFSVNNIEIDNQHKKWIEILNKVHDSLMSIDAKSFLNITAEALEAMHEYARKHFSFEEEYMHEIGYPDVVAHRRIHKDFDSLIYSYNRDIREGKIVLNTELLKIIKNWLFDHILIEDKKYAAFIKDKSSVQ
jgi:hemerythrin